MNMPKLISYTATSVNEHTQEIAITFTVTEKDFIYKDFITVSVHEPTVIISAWKTNKLPIAHYDPLFKDTKQIFNEDFTVFITATAQSIHTEPMYLYCSYYRRSDKKINQILIPLFFTVHTPIYEQSYDTNISNTTTGTVHKKITPHHITLIDDYYLTVLSIMHTIITSFVTEHKKYFLFFIMLIILFLLLSHFLKKQLEKQNLLKEVTDVIISLLGIFITIYSIFYINIISTPFITITIANCCSLSAGFFYTKKSTKLQSGSLRTLCTIIGTLGICCAIFLSFKMLQYF